MYSPKIVENSVRKISDASGIRLKRYTVDACIELADHIDSAYSKESKQYTRNLSREELDFIRNEQLMCSVDFLYWAKRYARIKTKRPGKPERYCPWDSQLMLHELMVGLEDTCEERRDGIMICNLKARQLGMCLSADSKVLTSDLSWVPISEIKVGQELVSVNEQGQDKYFIAGKVEAKCEVKEPFVRMTMINGMELEATEQHRFLWRGITGESCWKTVGCMNAGDEIRYVQSPYKMGADIGNVWIKIAIMEYLPKQRMIDLQTSTKTYIANGFVSHNSTVYEMVLSHKAFFTHGFNGLLAADDPNQSEFLFGMMERIYDNLPEFLRPMRTFHVKGAQMVFRSMDSMIIVQHGNLRADIGRGKTVHGVHLSELEKWENTEQIDSGLMPALPRLPTTMAFFESTGEYRGSWWHAFCNDSMDEANRFTMFFVPWYAEPNTYSKPAPSGWRPDELSKAHARQVERDSPKWMRGRTCQLTRDQLFFWEFTRNEYAKNGKTGMFFCEYASSPQEAFRSANSSVFTYETIEFLRSKSSNPKAYEVRGKGIDHESIRMEQIKTIKSRKRKV